MAKKNTTDHTKSQILNDVRTVENGKSRKLRADEKMDIIRMLAQKERPDALDVLALVPKGSFLARVLTFFKDTDCSYALPLWQLIMIAASYLTQGGAGTTIAGLGHIRPNLWTLALAPSGSAKTLAADEVAKILIPDGSLTPIRMLATGSTDAQWIIDLADNNGSYWLQDEAGQFFQNVLKNPMYSRIKPWMLEAYSNKPISNRLKSEKVKLEVEDPHFTFFGLTVRETWKDNVDAASMLDGFCQRFNYVIAPKRTDTDMFDHFLYFSGAGVDDKRAELRELWESLCYQEGALGSYELTEDVLPFLSDWWLGLRSTWGDGELPGSFIRRTGYSVLSYLVVLHFLLGRSRQKIDLETAELATKFAEFHIESTNIMMREYGDKSTKYVQKVAGMRRSLLADGKTKVTPRDIQQRLGKNDRKELSTSQTREILEALECLETPSDLFDDWGHDAEAKAAFLKNRLRPVDEKLKLNEKWRNQKRLEAVRDRFRKRFDETPIGGHEARPISDADHSKTVVKFPHQDQRFG